MNPVGSKPRRISATVARVHLGEVLDSLEQSYVIVERSGSPIAAFVSYQEFKRLQRIAGEGEESFDWWSAMVENARQYRSNHSGEPMTDATELIRQMREERDEELLEGLR